MNIGVEEINDKYFIKLFDFISDYDFTNSNFSIFNSYKFFDLHRNKNNFVFCLFKKNIKECHGIFSFSIDEKDKVYNSPFQGSFGNFEFINNLKYEIKEKFIKKVLLSIENDCAKKLIIKFSPDIYNIHNNSQVISILLRNNFKVHNSELNQFIDLTTFDIENSISYGNKKRIKNCLSKGIKFRKLEKENFHKGYQVIVANRARRNFPLTMSWEAMQSMEEVFGEKLHFFSLNDNEMIIATAICLNVVKDILYVFYWGEIEGYEKLSPITLLFKGIAEFGNKNNFKVIDIGTSTKISIPNYGLINFKTNLGCLSCNKFQLIKSYK